jgi:hypothetical protein
MEMSDPEGRAEKLMLFTTDPVTYITKFVMKLENTPALIGALNGTQPPPQLGQPVPQGLNVPQNPTVTNTANVPAQPPMGVPASPSNAII